MEIRYVRNMARVAFFMVPFVYEGEVGWGQRGGGGGVRFVIKRGPFRSEVVRFV